MFLKILDAFSLDFHFAGCILKYRVYMINFLLDRSEYEIRFCCLSSLSVLHMYWFVPLELQRVQFSRKDNDVDAYCRFSMFKRPLWKKAD
jgi:hypothetical protein